MHQQAQATLKTPIQSVPKQMPPQLVTPTFTLMYGWTVVTEASGCMTNTIKYAGLSAKHRKYWREKNI